MFTLEYAKDPVYSSADNQSINLTVKWEEFPEEHDFTASANDSETYGVALYNRANIGEFGTVQPYVAPPEPEPEPLYEFSPEMVAQLKKQLGL